MKKTLIALMAASSMAMAVTVTLEEAAITEVGNTGYDTLGNNFTVALTLDVTTLRTLLERGQTPAWGTDIVRYDCNGTATGVTVNGGSGGGQINTSRLYARWGNNANWNSVIWHDSPSSLSDLNGSAGGTGWDDVASAGLVYAFSATDGTTVAFTLIRHDGSAIVDSCVTAPTLKPDSAGAAALTFHDSVTGSYYFNDYKGGDAETMKALANSAATTAPVPEPTTATLSLLALAGLAARRRRK